MPALPLNALPVKPLKALPPVPALNTALSALPLKAEEPDMLLILPVSCLLPRFFRSCLTFLRSCFTGSNSLRLRRSVELPDDCVEVVVAEPCELLELRELLLLLLVYELARDVRLLLSRLNANEPNEKVS